MALSISLLLTPIAAITGRSLISVNTELNLWMATLLTISACSIGVQNLWIQPTPPKSIILIAMLLSHTVSIGDATIGISIDQLLDIGVLKEISLREDILEWRGINWMSS